MAKRKIVLLIVTALLALAVLGGLSFFMQKLTSEDAFETVSLTEEGGEALSSIRVSDLAPGESFKKSYSVRAESGTLSLSFRIVSGALADYLSVEVESGGQSFFAGTLSELALQTPEIGLSGRTLVTLRFSLPSELGNEIQNMSCEFEVLFRSGSGETS